jgi:predicted PurR-regulated permease PerM
MDWQFLLWMLLRFIIPFAIAVFFMWVAFRIIRELNRIEGRLKEIRDRLPRA